MSKIEDVLSKYFSNFNIEEDDKGIFNIYINNNKIFEIDFWRDDNDTYNYRVIMDIISADGYYHSKITGKSNNNLEEALAIVMEKAKQYLTSYNTIIDSYFN